MLFVSFSVVGVGISAAQATAAGVQNHEEAILPTESVDDVVTEESSSPLVDEFYSLMRDLMIMKSRQKSWLDQQKMIVSSLLERLKQGDSQVVPLLKHCKKHMKSFEYYINSLSEMHQKFELFFNDNKQRALEYYTTVAVSSNLLNYQFMQFNSFEESFIDIANRWNAFRDKTRNAVENFQFLELFSGVDNGARVSNINDDLETLSADNLKWELKDHAREIQNDISEALSNYGRL